MRDAAIAEFVRRLTVEWFQPPRGMDAAAQSQQVAEIARAVRDAIPRRTDPEAVDAALEGARAILLRSARSRAWPIIREVVDAVRASLPRTDTAMNADEAEERRKAIRLDVARKWWRERGELPGWASDDGIVKALLRDGVRAHDLWRAGVDVPREFRDWHAARGQTGSIAHRRWGDDENTPAAAE